MNNDDAARALYTQCINMPGNDEWCIALLAAALDEARREGIMSAAPGLTKYWTVPGASLLLEEPQPKTFIPRWGLAFASEAVYLASEVEAREREIIEGLEMLADQSTPWIPGYHATASEIMANYALQLLGRLRCATS